MPPGYWQAFSKFPSLFLQYSAIDLTRPERNYFWSSGQAGVQNILSRTLNRHDLSQLIFSNPLVIAPNY